MKHCQEVSKSDLQALKIWLRHFLGMFHMWELRIKLLKFLQWKSMGVHDFPVVKIGLMGAINHCFNNKSQTDPSPWYVSLELLFVRRYLTLCISFDGVRATWFKHFTHIIYMHEGVSVIGNLHKMHKAWYLIERVFSVNRLNHSGLFKCELTYISLLSDLLVIYYKCQRYI